MNCHCWRWRKSRSVRRRWPCRGTPTRGKQHCTSITLHSINKSTPHLLRQINYQWETVIPSPRTVCSRIQTHPTMTAALENVWSNFRSIIWRGVVITWKEVPENCFFLLPRGIACYTVCVYREGQCVCVCVCLFFRLVFFIRPCTFLRRGDGIFSSCFFCAPAKRAAIALCFRFLLNVQRSLRCC